MIQRWRGNEDLKCGNTISTLLCHQFLTRFNNKCAATTEERRCECTMGSSHEDKEKETLLFAYTALIMAFMARLGLNVSIRIFCPSPPHLVRTHPCIQMNISVCCKAKYFII